MNIVRFERWHICRIRVRRFVAAGHLWFNELARQAMV